MPVPDTSAPNAASEPRVTGKPSTTAASSTAATFWRWLLWAAVVIVLDQLSKQWIVANFVEYQSQAVTGFFNLVRVHNPGAAFSFLSEAGGWQRWFFSALAVLASLLILWMLRTNKGGWLPAFGLGSILGGALGNLIDRLLHGHVIDFLDFYWGKSHFPAFNLADSAITLGVILLLLHECRVLFGRR